MSSVHESNCDTEWDTNGSLSAGAAPDECLSQPPGKSPTPSYSTHFHLNYETTFHGMENGVRNRHAHEIRYSCRLRAGTSVPVPQADVAITCEIGSNSTGKKSHLEIKESVADAGPVAPPEDSVQAPVPESTHDALKSMRERRSAALKEMFGAWKDRDDTPKDGLQYQIETRAECP